MILDQLKLEGRVALVTGVGRGLSQTMALALAEARADIVALDRRVFSISLYALIGITARSLT